MQIEKCKLKNEKWDGARDLIFQFAICTFHFALCIFCFSFAEHVAAAEPVQKKEPPQIALCLPLAVPTNSTTKIVVRGWRFEGATEVRVADGKGAAKNLSQSNATVPDKLDPKRIGDRQIEIELTLPPETPAGMVTLVVVTPDGESLPHALLVGGQFPIVADTEPNDGFRQPQTIAVPRIVDGSIHANQNVDVFALEGTAGQKIVCEIFAARHGSALDGTLTLFDARGNVLATADDQPTTVDPRLEFTLPAAGRYFLVLQDAHDRGGPLHLYRLMVNSAP